MNPNSQESNKDLIAENEEHLKILLAYDGSRHSKAAVELLNELPLISQSIVTLLAVLPTQHIGGHEELQKDLMKIEQRYTHSLVIESVLRAGNPAATINEYASWNEIDLTIIGAKGLRATFGILLGGVAQQVVEYSACPVLVVREPFKGINRVLIVTDGSTYSQGAIEFLAPPKNSRKTRFPLPRQAGFTIMHVLPPPITPDMMSRSWTVGPEVLFPMPPAELDINALEQRESEEGKGILRRAVADLLAVGISADSILLRGDAATEILNFINENDIDLVIAGSRGLSSVTGWLLGSLSRKLVHYAGCSVLIVKLPEE